MTVPVGACSASFSFWLRITTSETISSVAYDKLTVTVRSASGTVLRTLVTLSNLNKNSAYQFFAYDLSAVAGQTVTVHFDGREDASLSTSFVVDDTAFNVVQ